MFYTITRSSIEHGNKLLLIFVFLNEKQTILIAVSYSTNRPFVTMFYLNHQLAAYVAILAVIPEHSPFPLAIQILFQKDPMVEHQPKPTDQPININSAKQ